MEKGRHAQYGAATGIVAVVLILIGFAIYGMDIPASDASPQNWQSFYAEHHERIQTGLTIVSVGLGFFLWFLGSLRDAIAGSESGSRLASIAHGGGLVATVGLMISVGAWLAAALHPGGLDPVVARAFNDFGATVAAPVAAGLVVMFAATAIAGYRRGALPPWVAGLAALAAICQLFVFPTGATDNGALAADGALGLWLPFITWAIAVLAISGSLVSRAGKGLPEAQTQTAT